MEQNDEPYMELAVYASILIMDVSSIFMISRLLLHFSRNESKNGLIRSYSPLLIATLICYGLYSLSSIPACVYILSTWSLIENHRVTRITFVVMVTPISVSAIISTTVFFLGLDKTLSILFPVKYPNSFKRLLFRLYILCAALVGLCVTISWVVAHFYDSNPEGCKSIGCTANSGVTRWQVAKLNLGVANCCIGAYFLYLWRFKHRHTSSNQRAAKVNNLMTVFAILVELLLNVLPWAVPLIVKQLTQFDIVHKFGGGYALVLSSLESVLFSHIYAYIFLRHQQERPNNITIETITTPGIQNHRVTRTTFIVLITPISVSAIISTTVFFLGFDKSLSILFPTKYLRSFKRLLFRLYLISAALVGLCVALSWVVAYFHKSNPEGCKSIACSANSGLIRWQVAKLTLGVANSCVGVYFLYLWRFKQRHTSSNQRAAKMNNLMTFFAIFAELFLNVLPWAVPLIVHQLTQFDIVHKFNGGYSLVLSNLESVLFSHIYAYIFLHHQQEKPNKITIETITTPSIRKKSACISTSYTQGL